jgi:hypothetical protein
MPGMRIELTARLRDGPLAIFRALAAESVKRYGYRLCLHTQECSLRLSPRISRGSTGTSGADVIAIPAGEVLHASRWCAGSTSWTLRRRSWCGTRVAPGVALLPQ